MLHECGTVTCHNGRGILSNTFVPPPHYGRAGCLYCVTTSDGSHPRISQICKPPCPCWTSLCFVLCFAVTYSDPELPIQHSFMRSWKASCQQLFLSSSKMSIWVQAGPLTDDELHTAMVKPLRHGVRLHAVIDACQSCPSLNLRCTARARRDGWSEWQVLFACASQ